MFDHDDGCYEQFNEALFNHLEIIMSFYFHLIIP